MITLHSNSWPYSFHTVNSDIDNDLVKVCIRTKSAAVSNHHHCGGCLYDKTFLHGGHNWQSTGLKSGLFWGQKSREIKFSISLCSISTASLAWYAGALYCCIITNHSKCIKINELISELTKTKNVSWCLHSTQQCSNAVKVSGRFHSRYMCWSFLTVVVNKKIRISQQKPNISHKIKVA